MNASAAKPASTRLALNEAALKKAKSSLDDGAVTPHIDGPWVKDIIKLLNDSLATELVCVMRYKRHYFTAKGINSAAIADEFLVHANEEAAHADRIAERIVQLGGEPDYNPATLLARSHADYDDSADLKAMIKANLIAERVAVEAYSQMIDLVGDKTRPRAACSRKSWPTSRNMPTNWPTGCDGRGARHHRAVHALRNTSRRVHTSLPRGAVAVGTYPATCPLNQRDEWD